MRAPSPRRALWTRPAGWIGAFTALAATAGVAACADSLHLDPPGTGSGGSGSTGSHGSASTGSPGCRSNPECTYPRAVCDTVAHGCVECLTFADCGGMQGTVCSKGACVCPVDTDAAPPMEYCAAVPGSNVGHCVDKTSSPSDCGACGHACFGSCVKGSCSDKWQPTATAGAPAGRAHHVAVWTGSRMIVWGGETGNNAGFLNSGGRYDPVKDTWQPTSLVNAPSPRAGATAVWDDAENVMLVWGGRGAGGLLDTGGRYDPATNAWTSMSLSNAPAARHQHTAVWGKMMMFMSVTHGMIVWGGTTSATAPHDDGYIYDPLNDAWLPILSTGPTARTQHTAVWNSGPNQMIVFGGFGSAGGPPPPPPPPPPLYQNDAWSFDPSTGWAQITATGMAPKPRAQHTAVWDGASMLVFGGASGVVPYLSDGAQLTGLAWTGLSTSAPQPEARVNHTAVWIAPSKAMLVFGGDQGGTTYLDTGWALDDLALTWKALPTAPEARSGHTAVVNGSTMIVWGGNSPSGVLATGAIFDTTSP